MNGAQVVGLVQARLRKRQPPKGPFAIVPLSYFTRAPQMPEENARKTVEHKSTGSSLEGDFVFLQPH